MFPFDLQARFAKAWLDAAAVSLATAGSMGSAAAQSMCAWNGATYAWNGSARPFSMSASGWPMFQPSTWASAWPWAAFTRIPSYGSAGWPLATPFSGADWIRTMSLGSTFASWPFLSPPRMTSYPAWDFLAAFVTPSQQYATLFGSWPLRQIETGWPVISSYRTASGHATSMLLRGFDLASSQPFYTWPDLSRGFFRL